MRSPSEITFRLRQEAANLWFLYGSQPEAPEAYSLPLPCPDDSLTPEVRDALRQSGYQQQITAIAEAALRHEFSLLGYTIQTGPKIRWRRDYVHGLETGLDYFRRIPYLDAARAGDHKIIWELNRHQHLVVLAQASLLTGRQEFLDELWRQIESWLDQNPFCRGMNWTSALEVAFRSLSWLWIEHLAGKHMPTPLRRRFLDMLFGHGRYLESNLSTYFSPNTHLQGEALALHALGLVFTSHPTGKRWQVIGNQILEDIIQTHVRADGGHFEQSSYYHVYATDMFLFHAILAPVSERYREQLTRMGEYLATLTAADGMIPLFGDDDGGRLFHPFGVRRGFGRETVSLVRLLAGDAPVDWPDHPHHLQEVALWWIGNQALTGNRTLPCPRTALFPDSGLAIFTTKDLHLAADYRGFGFGSAGHSHAHALHFTLRRGTQEILIDPGTYTYVGEPAWRDRFRGTAFHNTVTVDGLNQADPAGPFRWNNLPSTELNDWQESPWRLQASCRARGIIHRRCWAWESGVLFVLDHLAGAGTLPPIQQHWHPGGPLRPLRASPAEAGYEFATTDGPPVRILFASAGVSIEIHTGETWISPVPGEKHPAQAIEVQATANGPECWLATAFLLRPDPGRSSLRLELQGNSATLQVLGDAAGPRVEFSVPSR